MEELVKRTQQIRSQFEGKYHIKWPSDFKKEVIDHLSRGVQMTKITNATGIPYQTINNWQPNRKSNSKSKKDDKFKEVIILDKSIESSLTLSWSTGLEIKGLSFPQVQELLKKGLL